MVIVLMNLSKADIVRFLAIYADNPYLRGDVVTVPDKKHYSDQFVVYGRSTHRRFEHVGDRILDALQMAQGF